MGGGASLAEQQARARELADSVTAARAALLDARAGLAEVKMQAQAATQPIVIAPATATQPAVTVPAPAEVVKAAEQVIKGADKGTAALEKIDAPAAALEKQVTDLRDNLAKATTEQEARDARITATLQTLQVGLQTAQPFVPPQAQPWLYLGGLILAGVVGKRLEKPKTDQANDALNSAVAGVQAALANGTLSASPSAAMTVDSQVVAHPATDILVDAVAAAAKDSK
jgi:hypothetical protein